MARGGKQHRAVDLVGLKRLGQCCDQAEMPRRMVPPPLPAQFVPAASGRDENLEARMNVRITHRTADFQIPIQATSGGQSFDFLRAGMQSALGSEALRVENTDQLALDFELTEVVTAAEPVERLEAITLDADAIIEARDDDAVAEVVRGRSRNGALSHNDLEEISRRFAPQRQPE